jgi:hypothetical protein
LYDRPLSNPPRPDRDTVNTFGRCCVTARINKLLGKIAHVREAESPAHEAELKRLIAEATKDLAPGIVIIRHKHGSRTAPSPRGKRAKVYKIG